MKHNRFLLAAASLIPFSLVSCEKDEAKPGFFVTADLIYWKAHEEDLDFAMSGSGGTSSSFTPVTKTGDVHKPHFEWEAGFRVGAGYTLPKRLWDLTAVWTRFNTDAKASSHSGEPALLMILDDPNFATSTLTSASAKLKLHYNTLDFEVGRDYRLTRRTVIHPHGGIRGLWIDQNYSIDYNYGSIVHELKFDNDYHAGGLRAGFDTEWFLNPHLAFFGNLCASLVAGNFHIKQKYDEVFNSSSPPLGVYNHFHDEFFDLIPEVDLAMGIHLESYANKDRWRFEVNLGWELTVWFHQNMIRELHGHTSATGGSSHKFKGNLTLQGATIDVKLHF